TIHDFDTQDGVDFLVMELVRGETLESRMSRGAVPERELRTIGAQIADALEAAHEQGVVHRDLKPANVLLTTNGRVKLLDFGVVCLLGPAASTEPTRALTATGVVLGTVSYMAPEQLLGRAVDGRADLYALGVVLYEMATGRSPYSDAVATALVHEIIHVPVDPPRNRNPSTSARLEAIILHCLEKDPERRYASARELARDLRLDALAPTPLRRRAGFWLGAAATVVILSVFFGLDIGEIRSRFVRSADVASLAVVPLENLSRDPEQEYFADGMTEEISTRLAKISALRVIAHSSVVAAANGHSSLADIGHALHVRTLLAGSVRSEEDRVRITVQLVQAASSRVLWAESYDRPLRDVLSLQSEVAGAVAREIQVKLT